MASTTRFTKMSAYRYLVSKDLGWEANVFLTSGGSYSAANLKALATLVQAGISAGGMAFLMPTEHILVDGKPVTPAQMRDLAANL